MSIYDLDAAVVLRELDRFGIEEVILSPPPDMSFPVYRPRGPNPDPIFANIAQFERLLDHNPQAHIAWLHAGWDLTGERTLALMRRLLKEHDNPMMSIKYDGTGSKSIAPFLPDGSDLRLGWIAMCIDRERETLTI